MTHTCHAYDCGQGVPPKMFMCRKHWFMVPPRLRARIWATYRPGQEVDKNPSLEYLSVTNDARNWVRDIEGALEADE